MWGKLVGGCARVEWCCELLVKLIGVVVSVLVSVPAGRTDYGRLWVVFCCGWWKMTGRTGPVGGGDQRRLRRSAAAAGPPRPPAAPEGPLGGHTAVQSKALSDG